MENDFYRYSFKSLISFYKFIEILFRYLKSGIFFITDPSSSLQNCILLLQKFIIDLSWVKHKNTEHYSFSIFMLLDYESILGNSYNVLLKYYENVILLIKGNIYTFFIYTLKIFDKFQVFPKWAVEDNMEDIQLKSYEKLIRFQKKEDLKIKSKIISNVKNTKINNFKSSIEKLFRIKSKSEKCLKNDDLLVEMIPSTIYLSPQQKASLSRDTWYITNNQQIEPDTKESIRHSCSDFICRQRSTLCMFDVKNVDNMVINQLRNNDGSSSPTSHKLYPTSEEQYRCGKVVSPRCSSVPHSTSMPTHLSKSHQNITKCNQGDLQIIRPTKRKVRKKGLFNCSLFRKRSNTRSKSAERITEGKSHSIRNRDQSKSLTRSDSKNHQILPDRCLTLPNLKFSELDLTQNIDKNQLLSMDLIKDYINRSDNSLQSSVHRNSTDCNIANHSQQYPTSVNNSSHSLSTYKCDKNVFKTLKNGMCDSMILEKTVRHEPFYSQTSASNDLIHVKLPRATSPSIISNCALDSSYYKYSNVTFMHTEKSNPPCIRQISAPIYYQPPHSSYRQISPPLTNSAFDFWTRPYQEKLKASRRRLLDDKVGSKEALLRSLSPHCVKSNDTNAVYDKPYHLHIIHEPTNRIIPDSDKCDRTSQITVNHFESRHNPVQYRLTNQNITPSKYRPNSSASPIIENRLLESPKSISQRQEVKYKISENSFLIYNTDNINQLNQPTVSKDGILQYSNKINQMNSEEVLYVKNDHLNESSREMKDNKSINSSTELILTRTPTPPHSFAESSVSSIYPAPNEFISDHKIYQTHKIVGTVNLLYTSDKSEDESDEFSSRDIEPIPPAPPPRTDSIIRSLQSQQISNAKRSELEYDISDEFPPVFSGSNIDRCDIEKYHKWLGKLPYKLSEFPNILQCRKSAVSAFKTTSVENSNRSSTQMDLESLKQLKSSRKSIRSWNTSDNSKRDDEILFEGHKYSIHESFSIKKSFSYDQSLSNPEMTCITESSPTTDIETHITGTDSTLLKQYSHLYSLKPTEPNQSVQKFTRSKSIDLRNVIPNISNTSMQLSEKSAQKRKSVPIEKFTPIAMNNEISGKNEITNIIGSKYKVYPML